MNTHALKILVVEDEPLLRQHILAELNQLGYTRVQGVGTGQAALADLHSIHQYHNHHRHQSHSSFEVPTYFAHFCP